MAVASNKPAAQPAARRILVRVIRAVVQHEGIMDASVRRAGREDRGCHASTSPG